jgi:hypothetical protein
MHKMIVIANISLIDIRNISRNIETLLGDLG